MKKSFLCGCGLLLCALVTHAQTHDLSRDFSLASNPNGVWSYGWQTSLGGNFVLFTHSKTNISANGVPIELWDKPDSVPLVAHNNTGTTAVTDGGQGEFAPETTWFYPGVQGNLENYGVIRFTVPTGGNGTYKLNAAVRRAYNGSIQGDTDFHVLRNGVELFGQQLSAGASAAYSNTVTLAVGDAIHFAIGRGADNSFHGSGLKIAATLDLVSTNLPPPPPPGLALVIPRTAEGTETPFGSGALADTGHRSQQVYGSSEFPNVRILIEELRFRPDSTYGRAFSATVSNIQINMSTTQRNPNALSSVFAENTGPDDTVVLQGAMSISSQFVGPTSGPKAFDIVVRLSQPYLYTPANGSLVIDIRNFSGSQASRLSGQGGPDNAARVLGSVSNSSGAVDTGADAIQLIYSASPVSVDHDLSRDFSITANPNGPWSYGYETTPGSAFVLLAYPKINAADNGVLIWAWEKQPAEAAGVYHNSSTTQTAISDGGDSQVEPKTTYFFPGFGSGRPDNYSVIRFTAPAGGTYQLDTRVRPLYNTLQRDTDFHVLRNGVELYGVNLNGSASGGYSNEVALAAGDVIDLALGRGADNSWDRSGLKIAATLDLVSTNLPPPPTEDYNLSQDFSLASNPNGSWSYGWEPSLGTGFTLFTHSKTNISDNGVPMENWDVPDSTPAVLHNRTDMTAVTDGGQGNFPPGTTVLYPGPQGAAENFGVIRFSVATGGAGVYHLTTAVLPAYDGALQGDTDFHVLKNGTEVFGRQLAAGASATYADDISLAAGDTIDFVIGRGADNSVHGSGLKIAATLDLVSTNLPPPPPPATDFDLSRDFSITANPNGAWSYGYETTPGSAFVLLAYPKINAADNGVLIWAWEKQPAEAAGVYHNSSTTQTAISDGGDSQVEPKTTYFFPGFGSGRPDNYSVIRFTAPAGGTYQLDTRVRPLYNTLQRDTDFHVLRNGVELYGVNLNGSASGGYSNEVALAAGDVIDLALGRGADNSWDRSGLKIAATLDLVSTNLPPPPPPIAKAIISPIVDLSPKLTNLLVISVNGATATVTLDGSQSSDPEGGALTYEWFANGSGSPVASGVTANVSLAVGSHEITLAVSDGHQTDTDTVAVEVITINDMIGILVVLVDESGLPRKNARPLITALKQAQVATEGDRAHVAIMRLEQFQEKVAAQIAPINEECAELLIDASQKVIDALSVTP